MADYNPFPTVDLTGPATARQNIDGASPDAFGAGVGRQMVGLGQQIGQIGAALDPWLREEKQAKSFAAEEIFQKWQNKVEAKGREDSANLTGDGVGFTDGMLKYARTSLDEDFKAGGFTEVPPEYRVKLENSIGGYAKQFAGFELNKRVANQTNAIDSAAASQLITVMQHPDNNTRDTFEKNTFDLIDKSNLPAGEKEALKTKYRQQYDYYYGLGKSRSEPGRVISSVTGVVPGEGPYGKINNPYTKPVDASPIPGGPSASSHYSYLKSIGASDNEAIVLTAAAASESTFNPAAKHDGGIGFGLYGHNGARRDLMIQRYGVAPTWQNQAQFALNELRTRPEGLKVNEAKTVQDLTNIQMAFEAPQGYEPGAPQKGHNYTGRFATTERFVRELGGQAMPTGAAMDPVIARLPPNQQLQLAGQAEREMAQQDAARAAEQRAYAARFQDQLLLDVNDGKAGEVEVRQAFSQNLISGEQAVSMIKTANNLQEERVTAAQTAERVQNGGWFDPLNKDDTRGINALSNQYRKSGVPEAVAQKFDQDLYGATGIMTEAAQRGLRGMIFGGNPQSLVAGLQAAVGYMNIARARNRTEPFLGVEGGSKISEAASWFRHQTEDLGRSPQDAANSWAETQSPEFQRSASNNRVLVEQFQKDIRENDPTPDILKAVAPRSFLQSSAQLSPTQQGEMVGTFNELRTQHFQKYFNADAANAYALDQMKNLYGEVNGEVMKWPINKTYPSMPDGSYQYIWDQAKKTVKDFTGRDVEEVHFLPIVEGQDTTAANYKEGKAAPYQLMYSYKTPEGLTLYDRVMRYDGREAGWRPDPKEAFASQAWADGVARERAKLENRKALEAGQARVLENQEFERENQSIIQDELGRPSMVTPRPEPKAGPVVPNVAPPKRAGTVFRGMRVPE